MMRNETSFIIALGGNLPWRGKSSVNVIRAALTACEDAGFRVAAQSLLYQTPCFPVGAGPDYVNACALLKGETRESDPAAAAREVLGRLHAIEAAFDREREARWAGRTLDLDLIAMGDLVLPDLATWTRWRDLAPEDQARLAPQDLILPHPRLQDRGFVLVPLADVAPDWVHPVLGQGVVALLQALPPGEIDAVRPIRD
jgi:2-amino-4-hydroxy-6-hydroxymethyldihydropteridine diphosphokinase